MLKLLNICDFTQLEENKKKISHYEEKYGFHGFELIKFDLERSEQEIKNHIKGYHLRFFPMWIDLYLEKYDEIEKELTSQEEWSYICGGKKKEEMLQYYKRELKIASDLEVEYVVLHLCNVRLSETLTYKFAYEDMEVLKNCVDIINGLFVGKNYKFKLLVENLWWAGFKMLSKEEVKYLVENVKYENFGFMLDTGHMLHTNLDLKNSSEGVDYIKKVLEGLEDYRKYIKGVHLNYSLSGDYVKKALKGCGEKEVYKHVGKIDYHDPFEDEKIVEVLKKLPLEYLVYEFISSSDKKLEEKVKLQEKFLKKLEMI